MEEDELGTVAKHKPDYEKLRKNYRYRELELSYKRVKRELILYDVKWKSIIPSLALWSHMQSLEFYFDKEDSYLLSEFDFELGMEDKMRKVEEVLKRECSVNLMLYDIWSEESKEFLCAEDDFGKIVGRRQNCDGKLVKTTDGSTTIFIGRHVFGYLTELLWRELSKFLTIGKKSRYIYDLLKRPLTMKDKLSALEIRPELRSGGWPFLDILVEMKNIMEPKYHPLFRKELEGTLMQVWDYHTKKVRLHYYPHEEFPFSFFGDYSEDMCKHFQSKVNDSEQYKNLKDIKKLHKKFKSSPRMMADKFKSQSDATSFMSLNGKSGDILRQMCSKSLKAYEELEEHCKIFHNFKFIMNELFEITWTNKKLKKDVDLDVNHLMSQGFITDGENLEKFRIPLECFMKKWLKGLLPVGYAVLGILLYNEGSALPVDKRKDFISKKVNGSMDAMESYLAKIWYDTCYDEKVFRDLRAPARVISWCDDDVSKFPMSEGHKNLPLTLLRTKTELKRLEDTLTING